MSVTNKQPTGLDQAEAIRGAYNEVNASLSVDGFLTAEVGRKVDLTISTTTISGDTETYSFSESGTLLYTIKVIYTDGTRATMISAERTA